VEGLQLLINQQGESKSSISLNQLEWPLHSKNQKISFGTRLIQMTSKLK
jgi:hypothetical protein